MSEVGYTRVVEFRTEVVEFIEEVKAAEADAAQGIPRPHPDEPDPLYYTRSKLEQGLARFDRTFDQQSPDSFDAPACLMAVDSLIKFCSHAAEWYESDSSDSVEPLPDDVTDVRSYLLSQYQSGPLAFYQQHLSI